MENNLLKYGMIAGAVIIIAIVLILNPFVLITAGHRGVVLNWGAVSGTVLTEGIHWRTPIMQKVLKFDVQTQKFVVNTLAYSKDLQTITTKLALNYNLKPEVVNILYQEVGAHYESRIIDPAIQESVKAAIAQFTAQELIEERPKVKDEIKTQVHDRLTKYFVVTELSITDFEFTESYERAIENKQVAQQNALKAENDLKRIQIEAQQKIETAKADAESIKIQAQALLQNPALVDLKAVEKWNGVLPSYVTSGGIPFINVK